jgi:hypothetical protein
MKLYQKLHTHNGHDTALLVLKEVYNIAKSIALEQIPPAGKTVWLRSDKKGVPTVLKRILGQDCRRRLIGDVSFCRFALTLLSSYESMKKSSVKPDVLQLTSQSTETISDIEKSIKIPRFVKECTFPDAVYGIKVGPMKDFWSIKGGPNGPCTPSWKADLKVLENPSLGLKVSALEKKLDHTSVSTTDALAGFATSIAGYNDSKVKVSTLFKTVGIPDKGPKVRTITMANYFAQRALKPVHDYYMAVLRAIPEDGTYFQDHAAQQVKAFTSHSSPYCFDLSAATDRFPVWLQFLVVKRFTPILADEWLGLMSRARSTVVPGHNEIEFEVGQPMGVYSSWAIFTLTHHVVIRYAFMVASCDFRGNYYIIGDDVVIFNKAAAAVYRDVILSLGVEISLSKSVLPEKATSPGTHSGEFAKRYFRNGVEITPSRPLELLGLLGRGWTASKEVFRTILTRWELGNVESCSIAPSDNQSEVPVPTLLLPMELIDKSHRREASLLLSSPLGGPPIMAANLLSPPSYLDGMSGYEGERPSFKSWWTQWPEGRFAAHLKVIAEGAYAHILPTILGLRTKMGAQGTTLGDASNDTAPLLDPEVNGLTRYLSDINEVMKNTKVPFSERVEKLYTVGLNIDIAVIYYSTKMTIKDYLDLKSKRRIAVANLVIKMAKLVSKPPEKATMKLAGAASFSMLMKMKTAPTRLSILLAELKSIKSNRKRNTNRGS